MKLCKLASVAAAAISLSVNVNASVLNTLSGINYEWLELTATQGLSRDQVEAQIAVATPSDTLYGYEYASRELVKDLLLSYTSWDGIDGLHEDPAVTSGLFQYINDFGALYTDPSDGFLTPLTSTDNNEVLIDGYVLSHGLYGTKDECLYMNGRSCLSNVEVFFAPDGSPSLAYQGGDLGYHSTGAFVDRHNFIADLNAGSHLVRVSAVPIPAAVWLFGSGLLGLIGIARRKKHND